MGEDPNKIRPVEKSLSLRETSDDPVVLRPKNNDLFVKSQREIVEALRSQQNWMQEADELRARFHQMISEIETWAEANPAVAEVAAAPRPADLLVVVVAHDEDEEGRLDDKISALDLGLSNRYPFRVSFLMLREKERDGVAAFLDPAQQKVIFRRAER